MAQGVHKTLVLTKGGTKAVAPDEASQSLFDLGEPPWIKDEEVSRCSNCQAQFSFFVRKHHCRFCGNLYCGKCCESSIPSLRQGFIDPVRLCEECRTSVSKDNDFMQKQLPLLTTGAMFRIDEEETLCQLSPLHSDLLLGEKHDPVKLKSITAISDIQSETASHIEGVRLTYRTIGSNESHMELRIIESDKEKKKKTLVFIGSLKRGLQVVHGPTPVSPRKKKTKRMDME